MVYQFEWRALNVGGQFFRGQNIDGTKIGTHRSLFTLRSRYTMMNEIGQVVLCINLSYTSMYDPGLILGHEARCTTCLRSRTLVGPPFFASSSSTTGGSRTTARWRPHLLGSGQV